MDARPAPAILPGDRLLSTKEAAEYLGVCDRTLREHIREGLLTYIAVGRGRSANVACSILTT
jgi:excisionase family DNA binding protein